MTEVRVRELRLSPRLAAVAAEVLGGEPLADIGADHALLPMWLVQTGRVPRAIALDVARPPLAAARAHAQALGLDDPARLDLRCSDGLEALRPGEAATLTLCGLGGGTIAEVLRRAPAHTGAGGARRVVAQPNRDAALVRAWALTSGWDLVRERLVTDRGHIYAVLCLEPRRPDQPPPAWTAADLRWGPLLRRERPPLYLQALRVSAEALQAAALRAPDHPEIRARLQELLDELSPPSGADPSGGPSH